jgi:5-methylcytosine-specific restriction endonuclease McrA
MVSNTPKPSSLFHGVYSICDYWIVRMTINKKKYQYGPYKTELEASHAYDLYKKKYVPQSKLVNHPVIPMRKSQTNCTGRVSKISKSKSTSATKVCILNHSKSTRKQTTVQIKTKSTSTPRNCKTVRKQTRDKFQIPKNEIIRKKFPEFIIKRLCFLQKWKCILCDNLLDENYEIDHIIPLFLDGPDNISNLQALCHKCHHFKSCRVDHILKKISNEGYTITSNMILTIQKKEYERWFDLSKNPIQLKETDHTICNNNPIHININNIQYLCIPVAIFPINNVINDKNDTNLSNSVDDSTNSVENIEIIIENTSDATSVNNDIFYDAVSAINDS